MDERMAGMAPSHIWKKFLSLLASEGHSAFHRGPGASLKQRHEPGQIVSLCSVFIGLLKCIVLLEFLLVWITLLANVAIKWSMRHGTSCTVCV